MSDKYPGGFVTDTAPVQNPALGAATNGIWTMDQAAYAAKNRNLAMYDPYYNYVTMNLHGNGTNGAQNNTFLDSSSNNFTITRNGNTTQGSFSPYGSLWSNYFDSTGYIYSGSGSTALQFSTGAYTIEAWIYQSSRSGTQWIIGGASGIGFQLGITSAGYIFGSIPGVGDITAATTAVPLNTWTHVAYVRTSTGSNATAYYINGVIAGTATDANNISGTGVVNIGTTNNGTSVTGFNGYISNIRVVKGAAVYSGGFTPSTTPLGVFGSGTTSVLACQSNRFVDNSGTLTFSVSGSPSVQRFSPFKPNQSYTPEIVGGSGYFDGSGDDLTLTMTGGVGAGDFTIEYWLYPTSLYNYISVFSTTRGSTGLNVGTQSAGQIVLYSSSGETLRGTTAMKVNTWNHCAFTRSGTTMRGYLNGVLDATGTSSVNFSATAASIGSLDHGGEYATGYVSNLRVVSGTALYTGSTLTVPTAPLTAVTNTSLLLGMTNAGIADNSMMNDLETVGNAQVSTTQKKYGTASIACTTGTSYLLSQPSQNLEFGGGDFTIELWWYPTSTSRQALYHGSFGADYSIGIDYSSVSTNQKIGIWASSNGTTWNLLNADPAGNGIGTTTLTQNAWNHIAYVRNGTTWMLFVNGNRDLNLTGISGSIVNRSTYQKGIGVWWNTANAPFPQTGYIDDLRVTKGVARYTAAFTPPTSQLQDF